MTRLRPRSTSFPPPRVRFAAWVVCAIILLSGTLAWLWLLRGPRILDNDPVLIGGWIALGAVHVIVFALLRTTPNDAIRLSTPASVIIGLGGAAVLHLAALLWVQPALSEDVLRYRLDGRTWLGGRSPYSVTPRDFAGADGIDRMAPHAQLHTIYPPVSEAIFVALASIDRQLMVSGTEDRSWREWLRDAPVHSAVITWRIAASIVSLASTAVLIALLRQRGQGPWHAVLFAWNPLVIIETAGMAHQDILGVLLILLMVMWSISNRPALAAIALALAVGVKPPAMLLLPALLLHSRSRRATWVAFAITTVVIFVPALAYDHGYRGWLATARELSRRWEANGSIYELLKQLFGTHDPTGVAMENTKQFARKIATAAPLLVVLLMFAKRASVTASAYWIFQLTALISPVAYSWYLLWVLCFVPLLGGTLGLTAIVWSAAISASYLLWRTSDWILPGNVLVWEYVPVYAALALEVGLSFQRSNANAQRPTSEVER
jgi:hypothetical protein